MKHSYELVSLWDMLQQHAAQFTSLVTDLRQLEFDLKGRISVIDEIDIGMAQSFLMNARTLCAEMELDAALAQVNRIEGTIASPRLKLHYTCSNLLGDVKDLISRLQDQLSLRKFYYVRPKLTVYYGQDEAFGATVNDRFPKAIDDIRDAGNCLALGQGTACVMHLMRVMEVGLKALSADLGIAYAPSWESHLTQIEKQMATKHASKSVKWKKHQKFYRDVSGDLVTIKIAWRNPTMHIERRYDVDEAQRVYEAVRGLMQHLSTRLKS